MLPLKYQLLASALFLASVACIGQSKRILELERKAESQTGTELIQTKITLANLYLDKDIYDKSLEYAQQAQSLAETGDHRDWVRRSLALQGKILQKKAAAVWPGKWCRRCIEMCGRYALYGPISRVDEQFDASIDELPEGFGPRYNAAPLQMLPVVRQRPNGERVVHLLRWGLVPSWSKDDSIAAKLINARAESLAEKPSFRAAYKARRCIIPACGFFEWKAAEHGKQPYYIHPADGGLFGFAGLW